MIFLLILISTISQLISNASASIHLPEIPILFPRDCFPAGDTGDKLFVEHEIARVDVDFDDTNWVNHIATSEDKSWKDCSVCVRNSKLSFCAAHGAAKLRGNLGMWFTKKSFTVDFFKHASKSERSAGLARNGGFESVQLRAEPIDPSFVREFLMLDLHRSFGNCVQRKSFADVYVNGERFGVYLMAEHFDDRFVVQRVGRETFMAQWNFGCNLQPTWFAALDAELIGDGGDRLKSSDAGLLPWEPLRALQRAILRTSGQGAFDLARYAEVLDYDANLRAAALHAAANAWDCMNGNCNNGYLLYYPATGRFSVVAYDLDISFGSWALWPQARSALVRWLDGGLFLPSGAPGVRERFGTYAEMAAALIGSPALAARARALQTLLRPAVESGGVYPPVAIAYEPAARWFNNSFDGPANTTVVTYWSVEVVPLMPFVRETPSVVREQLRADGFAPMRPAIAAVDVECRVLPAPLAATLECNASVLVTCSRAATPTPTTSLAVHIGLIGLYEERRFTLQHNATHGIDGANGTTHLYRLYGQSVQMGIAEVPSLVPNQGKLVGYWAEVADAASGAPFDTMPLGAPGHWGNYWQNHSGSAVFWTQVRDDNITEETEKKIGQEKGGQERQSVEKFLEKGWELVRDKSLLYNVKK
jgi:hypothetical protein